MKYLRALFRAVLRVASGQEKPPAAMPLPAGAIHHAHTFMDVVGESFHQDALQLILKKHGRRVKAQLVPEPTNPKDHNAVRVVIHGYDVGHLRREVAKTYVVYLAALSNHIICKAELTGAERGKPSIGVVLDFAPVYDLREKVQPF